MKAWSVIAVSLSMEPIGMWGRRENASGVIYVDREAENSGVFDGNIRKHQRIWFFDDESTADKFMTWALEQWPDISLIKSQSKSAEYREMGPRRSAVFTDKGLLPA